MSHSHSVPLKKKKEISFDLNGNPIGTNKSALKTRTLELVKLHVGLNHDTWRLVPEDTKNDIWNTLTKDYNLTPLHKSNILSQADEQWRTWKKNVRKRNFGEASASKEILLLKDKTPDGEVVPQAEWNAWIEREADPVKLQQRAQNKANRAKKTDVHLLGAKSYAQVADEWTDRTKGTDDEGITPSRTNLYLHARKMKSGEYHPNALETVAKIAEIQMTQGEDSTETDVDTDPLSQVFGKDNRGRTRGVGSKVSRTKYKAIQPAMSRIERLEIQMKDQSSKMDAILNLLQESRANPDVNIPSPGVGQSNTKKSTTIGQGSSTHPLSTDGISPIEAHKGYHYMRDLKNEKSIAMVKIEAVEPGTIVHSRPLQCPEAKVVILSIYPGMENEPVYLGRQGCATTLGDFGNGSFIAWPLYLLEKIL